MGQVIVKFANLIEGLILFLFFSVVFLINMLLILDIYHENILRVEIRDVFIFLHFSYGFIL